MKLRVLCLGLLTAVAAAGGPAGGQEKDRPFAFFSHKAAVPAEGAPGKADRAENLYLRPNLEQSAYVFVHNPSDADRTVTVILSHGAKDQKDLAGTELARARGVVVPKGRTVRVALAAPDAGKAAPAPVPPPPPPPPAPAAPGAAPPAPPAPPAGVKLGRTQLVLQTIDEAEKRAEDRLLDRQAIELDVTAPSERVTAAAAVPPGSNQFVVTVAFRKDVRFFTDRPAKVRLDLRPDLNPDLDPESLNAGTYEADLPPDGQVQLVAEGVRFKTPTPRTALVAVSVDGYDRAFLFRTNFSGTPSQHTDPFVNIRPTAEKLVPGTRPAVLQLEFANVAEATYPFAELRIDRRSRGTFNEAESDVIDRFPGLRKKDIYVKVGGPDDSVVLTPVLTDWAYEFPTANVFGVRTFKLQAVNSRTNPTDVLPRDRDAADAAREFNVRNVRAIVLDRTPPVITEFRRPRAAGLMTGGRVTVRARVAEDLTRVARVLFYAGDPPAAADAKLVPGKVVEGRLVTEKGVPEGTYEATLLLPEAKGTVQLGVKAFNEVGLASRDDEDRTAQLVDVRDPPAPREREKEKTTGTVKGRVTQGSRNQPGLPVELRDEEGKKVIKATTTSATGEFVFEDVPPGSYIVTSYKKVDAAKGLDRVAVEAGKTATASINVLR